MTTPAQEDIIERAFAIHHQRNNGVSSNNPEIYELKESGIYEEARTELIRLENSEYESYIEREARNVGLLEQKDYVDMTKHIKPQIWFDLEEIKKSKVLISGMNQTGKTRLACYLAHILRKKNFDVLVFDNSGVWRELSDISDYKLVSNSKKKISKS
jgi:signal recognition particle GTPase